MRPLDEFARLLAEPHPLQGDHWTAQQAAELREHPTDSLARAHRDDHHGDVRVAPEEPRPRALAVGGPIDAKQHARAGDTAPVQQVAYGDKGRRAVDAFPAADVDGQFGRLVQVLGQHDHADLIAQQAGTLERHQAPVLHLLQVVDQRVDALVAVDGDRDNGRSSERVSSRSVRR